MHFWLYDGICVHGRCALVGREYHVHDVIHCKQYPAICRLCIEWGVPCPERHAVLRSCCGNFHAWTTQSLAPGYMHSLCMVANCMLRKLLTSRWEGRM